jgi:hypothetical protein
MRMKPVIQKERVKVLNRKGIRKGECLLWNHRSISRGQSEALHLYVGRAEGGKVLKRLTGLPFISIISMNWMEETRMDSPG